MIIYNYNKEFIGIDQADLKALGFKDLSQLQSETADFADLFVKTPGHIHNFKHVHWIDFVLCAKSTDESKAIIHVNGKNFKVNLEIKILFLNDAPSSRAFAITLGNLKSLSKDEKIEIATEPQTIETPIVDLYDEAEDIVELDSKDLHEDEIIVDPYVQEFEDENEDEIIDIHDFTFDLQKTAEALEMPLSLIEEFIEDFINQAKEFKEKLYKAVEDNDMIELQALSHKLKGVAANLRVHDALEILSKINKAKDFATSKKDLDLFYEIISKLSGEEVLPQETAQTTQTKATEEDELDEILEIIDGDYDYEDNIEIDLEDDDDNDDDDLLIIPDDFDIIDDDNDDDTSEDLQYNKTMAADEIGLDSSSFNELFDDYISESQNLVMSIEDAIQANDSDNWKNIAFKLKGMSDNMRINNFVSELEVLIHTKDSQEAKTALEKIQTKIFEILKIKD